MVRSRTADQNGDVDISVNNDQLPPWERGNIAQVPYLDASSPSLSNVEREALPSLWAVQRDSVPMARHRTESHTRYGSNASRRRGYSSDDCINPWEVKTPLTAPPPPRPYDTPAYIPPGPKSTPYPPTFVKSPQTPSDSDFGSCGTASTPGSPQAKQEFQSLHPIPAGVESKRPNRTRAPSSSPEPNKRGKLLQRWKSALKEMFTHHPVDDSELEYISADRHWTDE